MVQGLQVASGGAALPPLGTVFELGDPITPTQQAFLDRHGYLHFRGVATAAEVQMVGEERDLLEARWLGEARTSVYGVPLFFGWGEGRQRRIHRIPFASEFSPRIRAFIRDPRFRPLLALVGPDARVGDAEKDGVVLNRYENVSGSIYRGLGWHTDGARDWFYGHAPKRMLNIGLHLDRIHREDGGLRLIPGTQEQGAFSMLFRKVPFLDHRPDADEVCVETEPGDVTVHDGRLWHRVAPSERHGAASVRRSMYVPFVTGPVKTKGEHSTMPLYHHLGRFMRRVRGGA